jgi:ElaB/YqjD/DUF883 family membrane-anchored ribosome-binding protein
MTTPSSADTSTSAFADQAAESADAAIRSARQKAHDALDGLSDKMQNVKEQATATLEKLRPQLDSVASYAKEEPTKALLIAAASGAALMGLIALLGSSGGSRSLPSSKSLRKAAADTADDWRKAATDAADDWRKAAFSKADSWRKAASDAADQARSSADETASAASSSAKGAVKSAYAGLTDTVAQWRDQAAPLVDKLKPQIDAVTTYAKDDPGKALLIAAAAGAALMGLLSTINR